NRLIGLELPLPTYEMVLKASHTFNLLDARRAISVTARQQYILRVRTLARAVAQSYLQSRAKLCFPMATPDLRDEVLAKLEAAEWVHKIFWSSWAPKSCHPRRWASWPKPFAAASSRA